MMSSYDGYPEKLRGLGLSFEESIYAIVFDLGAELRRKDKAEVFADAPSQEQMAQNVADLFEEFEKTMFNADYEYALRKFLGYPVPECCRSDFVESVGAASCAEDVVRVLRRRRSSAVCLLMRGAKKRELDCNDVVLQSAAPDVTELTLKVQQLMEEVRFYDRKRDQALAMITTLMTELNARLEELVLPKIEQTIEKPTVDQLDMDGSISQICWPYRSLHVLRSLKIETLQAAVEYFSDFNNFVHGQKITLWEWAVIVAVLDREKLLPVRDWKVIQLQDCISNDVFTGQDRYIASRIADCIRRNGLPTVGHLVSNFAGGAESGWYQITKMRGLGVKSQQNLIEAMRSWKIDIPQELFDPTTLSVIEALDFDDETVGTLHSYEIQTIGQLQAACDDQSRFAGLRYINEFIYKIARRHLDAYGFSSD